MRPRASAVAILAALIVAALLPAAAVADPPDHGCRATVTADHQGVHTAGDNPDGVLWPPNHKFHDVAISAHKTTSVDKDCDVTITMVRQDEPVDATGSGNTSPDAQKCSNAGPASTVELRAERSGGGGEGLGNGRYYHVIYTVKDPDTMTTSMPQDAKILVPHDQGIKHTSRDEGPAFDSNGTDADCS